ncbi:LarC family nickel insertion protein [Acuticoccus sp.]|uniref:LarC family nickel insertion protein n=1 Tax=Acuticoccus sp. TaxID=1904378 RepID=UPI003B51EE63
MALHVHLDAVGGVAGDMFAAAMLAARPDLAPRVLADCAAALPDGAGEAELTDGTASGITGRRLALVRRSAARKPVQHADFVSHIEGVTLSPGTAEAALAILARLAAAEATIHGVAQEDVHFHEMADWDTVLDVVAAGSIAAALGATWSVSPLPLGAGLVRAAHGLLPVPAPATAAILTGYDWHDDGIAGERVTPTGAAIVAHLTGGAGNGTRPSGRLAAVGHGLGRRTLDGAPNVLRALLLEREAASAERIALIAFEVDDMTGEEIAAAADRLRGTEGVRDVTLVPALGKKGRPVHRFEVQADPSAADRIADAAFAQTSTLGLRRCEVRRDTLTRHQAVSGGLRVKHALRPGGIVTAKVEQDDVGDLATLAARREAARQAEQ